jgi:lysophospholipase L1-like esterase
MESFDNQDPRQKNRNNPEKKSLSKKESLIISEIQEKINYNQLEIFFTFTGGGAEIFHKIDNIHQTIINKEDLPEELKLNFGINVDGNKKQFVAIFYIDKNNPNIKKYRKLAKKILIEIKQKLLEQENK